MKNASAKTDRRAAAADAHAPKTAGTTATPAERLYQTFERSMSETAAAWSRDPTSLALGAGLLRAQLLWARSLTTAWEAARAPFDALVAAAAPGAESR
jgi:hypothetical protein